MLQKILLVLLVLATGFAVSGVSAVVLAEVKSDKLVLESTAVDSKKEFQEVLLVVKEEESSKEVTEPEVEAVTNEKPEEVVEKPVRNLRREVANEEVAALVEELETEKEETEEEKTLPTQTPEPRTQLGGSVFTVPFYSQFADITAAEWKKVGCGVASLTMLVDFYKPNAASVDELLQKGIAAGAYISNAGWSHQGLINLSKEFGLNGQSISLAGLSTDGAFEALSTVLKEGPVMASVHYTFDPKNPIPHLVVVNGVSDGKVFYNDPAEKSGGGSISIAQFQSAWKKRYIEIRPVS